MVQFVLRMNCDEPNSFAAGLVAGILVVARVWSAGIWSLLMLFELDYIGLNRENSNNINMIFFATELHPIPVE